MARPDRERIRFNTRCAGGTAEQKLSGNIRAIEGETKGFAVNGDVHAVQDIADNLTKGQGHNCQIVALESQHGNTDEYTHDACQDTAGDNRHQKLHSFRRAEGLTEIGGNHNSCERAHRHETGVAQAQLSGNTDGQIQGNRHHNIHTDRNQKRLCCTGHGTGFDHGLTDDKGRNHNQIG